MNYKAGQTAEGKVTGIQPYGAFVSLDKDTSGLIHISEISDGYVRDITNFVNVGDTVKVKIIDFDSQNNQARLSLKALNRSRTRIRKRPMTRRSSAPVMKLGFSSIEKAMPQWIRDSEEMLKGSK